jgi:hypothetical protein
LRSALAAKAVTKTVKMIKTMRPKIVKRMA